MKCPRCGIELSREIFDPDGDQEYCERCPRCRVLITTNIIRTHMEPSDCLCVQDGDIPEEEFDEFLCQDCHAACILANQESDIELVQDEDGEWSYLEN